MRATILFLGFAALSSANIIFNHVPLKCSLDSTQLYHGCLRGQICEDSKCIPTEEISYPLSFRTVPLELQERQATYSTDGTCGPSHGNTICDPKSTAYTGGCCSQYGYCGNSDAHCGVGCFSGCTTTSSTAPTSTPSSTAPRSDGRCGSGFAGATCDPKGAYGGCCSQYGYCGSTSLHCLVSNGCQNGCLNPSSSSKLTTSTSTKLSSSSTKSTIASTKTKVLSSSTSKISSPSSTLTAPRSDGRCGSGFNGATCDPSGPYGKCCSQYGYCGSTTDHCLVSSGCQNGCTGSSSSSSQTLVPNSPSTTSSGEPIIAPVTSTVALQQTSTAAATTDGTCGTGNGNTVCGNWPQGNCCSMYGYCGDTSAHCGAGCQSGNCTSQPSVVAPGPSPAPAASTPGTFNIVGQAGVPAMHAALMPNGRVFFLDKVENYTQIKLPSGYYAYSSEYDPATNQAVGLSYTTNAFCSGGTFLADGRVISVGGNAPLTDIDPTVGDGFTAIRYLNRNTASMNGQSWSEPGNKLNTARWYATAQTMPDGTIFVASGSLNGLDPTVLANNNPTYEILSASAVTQGQSIPMDILTKNQPYYMYPFIHLLNDGTLFVFTSKSSQIFNVASNTVVKALPDLPGDYRTYPNTGGNVLLPLSSANKWAPDIVICGGGAYQDITSPTDPSCGRIQPLSANPSWEMDSMPEGRGMVEATLLADGTVLWLNGGNRGAQGFELMASPTLEALLYNSTKPLGQRWTTLASSTIPRLYHSVALLLLDGTVMVAGSNPVQMPKLKPDAVDPYVTEFRVENYVPPYLQGANANKRPTGVTLSSKALKADGSKFTISFTAPANAQAVKVVMYQGGYVTHSVHMGHRMMQLDTTGWQAGKTAQSLSVSNPPNHNVCPPGPYVIYVLVDGIPAIGQFVSVT